jgi:beta-RFAP synthase
MTRVSTGSRLHFGLFRLPPLGPWPAGERFYGGVGLMVERPGARVIVEPAPDWSATGPLGERALTVARRCAAARPEFSRPQRITVEKCAPEHVGLGTGTQLSLAVARALAVSCGRDDLSAPELARLTGRGRRSGVGVHGFASGGFLVDGGKSSPEDLAELVARREFPASWRVVLLTPVESSSPWHGRGEDEALAAASATADDSLRRLALDDLLPALIRADVAAFGEALFEFNARAAEPFRAAQGGTYSASTSPLVEWLRGRGVHGVGQSSWGPTAFGVVGDVEEADALAVAARLKWADSLAVVVTSGRNGGASGARAKKSGGMTG